jgi:Mg-chelatase subunit ChlD
MKMVKHISKGMLGCLILLLISIGFAGHAAADSQSRSGLDVIFALDNSGSMLKNDPDFITRTVVINFLEGLDEDVRVGMVIFDTDARLVQPLTGITTAESAESFLEGLDMITYKGQFTNTPAGMERAVYELKTTGRDEAEKVVILLTDGIVDTGDKDQDLESEKWLKENLTLECKKLDIRIFGIAFTEQADFRLMQTLAVKTEGEYFRAFTAEEVASVFKTINDIISKPAAVEPVSLQQTPVVQPQPVEKIAPPAAPVKPAEDTPAQTVSPLFTVLIVILVLAAVVLAYFGFLRKKKTILIKPDTQVDLSPMKSKRDRSLDQAELIDTENIISTDSITLPLDRESVSIGRDPSNDIVIPRESISSLHATIDYKNGYYYLEDLRSTNGTRLNDKSIKENDPVRLKSGDKIHFAIYEFRFLMHDLAPYGETVMIKKNTKLELES